MKRMIKGLVLCLFLLTFLTACKEEPSPEAAFKEYVNKWEKMNFEDMYKQLTTTNKEQMTKEEFADRYKKIYGDIEVSDLSVEYISPEEEITPDENGEIILPYKISMKTVAGPIEFSHTSTLIQEELNEEKQWVISWNPSMIFSVMGEGDEVKLTVTSPVRGEIVDRYDRGLAVNGEVYEVGVVPEELDENRLDELAEKLGISRESIDQKMNASWVQPQHFVPIKRMSTDEQVFLTEIATTFKGVRTQRVPSRVYPYKDTTANLVGYITSITQEDLDELEDKGYTSTDVLGKKGLEMVFEEKLRGEKGVRIYIKKENEEEFTLVSKPAKDGETIKLAIDIEIQQLIFKQLKDGVGAATAIHPLTGETLALVSSPSFDPNDFVLGISSEKWKELSENPNQPLINRVGYAYAPGSTIKPITAAIALENNVITPEQTMDIQGLDWADDSWGGYKITRVTDPGKPVNLRDALLYSDNIYFAKTALDIGADQLEVGLKSFGFAETLPFEYPFYDSSISNEGLNRDVLIADTGYGQGEIQMSPLHLAITYTPFLNEGDLLKPRLVLTDENNPEIWHEDVISPENAGIIRDDLIAVIEDPHGTGKAAKIDGLTLGGKTGTAELKGSQKEQNGKENGLFVAFDTDTPELLIAMLVEGEDSKNVVPKVKKVFEDILMRNGDQ
jgi:penicillin-binding protein 3